MFSYAYTDHFVGNGEEGWGGRGFELLRENCGQGKGSGAQKGYDVVEKWGKLEAHKSK